MADAGWGGTPVAAETVVDPVFGAISWQLGRGRLVLTGEAVPDVELVRHGDDDPREGIPIGTRRGRDLTLTVAGRAVELEPGHGRLTRRSYRVRVHTHDGDLLITPSSPTTSRLVRGRTYRGDNELGILERYQDGTVFMTWSETVTGLGVVVQAPIPEATEAALGYALAAAFGTGALFLFTTIAHGLEQLLPG